MDEEFLEVNDLDWFASYQNGLLAHFATGGRGVVPAMVRKSISEYEVNYDFFHSIIGDSGVEIIEGNLPVFNSLAQREQYLSSFVEMAKKGIFSHDVSGDGGYKLIARPKVCRRYCDLPVQIKSLLFVLSVNPSEIIEVSGFV
ncbi:hypothetical protein SAMN03159362_2273 [Pseudomonas sp. NFIX51]|nr:hypothetical protein SAMN03159414_1241 [Pseudomonas sp. NFACC41-3]SMH45197.1 hypothetical protein SAMN03159362_2273 [Pseudomonas sp. NFIX51]